MDPITTRKDFLAYLKSACGYDGPADIEKVKAFLAERAKSDEPIELVDEAGAALNIDDIWAKVTPKRVTISPQSGETEDEKEERLRSGGTAIVKRSADAGRVNRANAALATAGKFGDRQSAAKKSYDARAKTGATAFPDADLAEACTAYLRLANATVNNKTYGQMDADDAIVQKAAASGVVMTMGGALVPEDFRAQLIYLSEMYGVARRLATVVPMSRDTATYPRLTGEFSFAYSGENTAATAAILPTDQVNLTAKKIIGLAQIPNELLEDSAISVADMYARGFAKGVAKAEDQAYLIGDGTSTYGGIVGVKNAIPSTALYYAGGASNSGKDTWPEIVEADINQIVGLVENVDHTRCAFICSRQFYFTVMMALTAASGRGTINEFLSVNGTAGPAQAQWRGWPVYFSQVLPTVTAVTTKSLYFGDYGSASMFGDRKEMTIVQSDQRYFDADQTAIRCVQRFAVNVHGDGRGSTYGPIVALSTSTT